jgi:hypothetical protein
MANFFRFQSTNVPISEVKLMILKHVGRLKSSASNLDHEAIAVELDEVSLRKYLDDNHAKKLIAFFGVDSVSGQYYSTVVLTGLDSSGNFILDSNGDILATERWQRYQPVSVPSCKSVDNDVTVLDKLLG